MVPVWASLESWMVTLVLLIVSAGLRWPVLPLRVWPFRSNVTLYVEIATFSLVSASSFTVEYFGAASNAACRLE